MASIGSVEFNLMHGDLGPPHTGAILRTRPGRDGVRSTLLGERFSPSELRTTKYVLDAAAADAHMVAVKALVQQVHAVVDGWGVAYPAVRVLQAPCVRTPCSGVVGAGATGLETVMVTCVLSVTREA